MSGRVEATPEVEAVAANGQRPRQGWTTATTKAAADTEGEDGLSAARGIVTGAVISIVLWAGFVYLFMQFW